MPPRAAVLPGVLLLAWLLLAIPHGLTAYDLLAGVAAGGVGLLAGAIWPRSSEGAARVMAAADDLLGEGGEGEEAVPSEEAIGDAQGSEGGPEGDPERLDPEVAPTAVAAVLERLAESLNSTRLTVWRVDTDADEVIPEHTDGVLPPKLRARGNPLVWALKEGSPLRLAPVPRWARGSAVVAPIGLDRVLTMETAIGEPDEAEQGSAADGVAPTDHSDLLYAAGILAPFLRLRDQQAHAVAASRRVERVVHFLRSVPSEEEPGRLSMALARSAMGIAGGTGALVASWSGDEGTVLVRQGVGGGPAPGTTFGLLDGDLAHAARTGVTVRREPADGARPPLASDDERWERPPPYRTVFPLVDPHGETTGLLAVWGLSRPSEQGVALLEAIAPLQALQLRQADDLERYRARVNIDALTGLPNRAALDERMAEERARFHRSRRPLALLVIDLDHFKRINDTHGHDAGDLVLRRVAEVVQAAIRDVDFAARFGGEELVVVLPETMLPAALEVAERVRAAVEGAVMEFEGISIPVTASIGVSVCPDCVEEPDALFASADRALYASKEAGRNRVTAASGRVVSGGAES